MTACVGVSIFAVGVSSIGKPVFGDPAYGGRAVRYGSSLPKIKSRIQNLLKLIPRQALHAKTLGFVHPLTHEMMRFNSGLPEDLERALKSIG